MELKEGEVNQVPSFFLNALLKRYHHLHDLTINTIYPNFGLIKGDRSVIFHHRHFCRIHLSADDHLEKPDLSRSERLDPQGVGPGGKKLRLDRLLLVHHGPLRRIRSGCRDHLGQDAGRNAVPEAGRNLATGLAEQYGVPGSEVLGDWIISKIVDFLVHKLVYSERKIDQLLSDDAKKGLLDYVNEPLKLQISEECGNKHPISPRRSPWSLATPISPLRSPGPLPR